MKTNNFEVIISNQLCGLTLADGTRRKSVPYRRWSATRSDAEQVCRMLRAKLSACHVVYVEERA